jgi:hypothetical protein
LRKLTALRSSSLRVLKRVLLVEGLTGALSTRTQRSQPGNEEKIHSLHRLQPG